MKNIKLKSVKVTVNEQAVAYGSKKKRIAKNQSINQLLITPKDQKSFSFLKKLLEDLTSVNDVEVLVNGEVQDYELLKQMEKNSKSGYVSQETVMDTLNAIINKK